MKGSRSQLTLQRLALDTISLCAFDYRFNNFYREDMHPFVDAMVSSVDFLSDLERLMVFSKPVNEPSVSKFSSLSIVMMTQGLKLISN
jgi:hypothetical protein